MTTRYFNYSALWIIVCIELASPVFAAHRKTHTLDLGHEITADWTLRATAGTDLRTHGRSKAIINRGNLAGARAPGHSQSGDLNYDKGDFVSGALQTYGSLKLQYQNFGVFVSGEAWYDYVQDQADVSFGNAPDRYQPDRPLSDDGFDRRAKFSGATFEQVYAFGKFNIADHKITAKVGKQLLLWQRNPSLIGLFINGSLLSLDAPSLPDLYRPGTRYKQYFVPAGMATIDAGLTRHLDAKVFYQFDFQPAVLAGCGTFFSQFDDAAIGCDPTFAASSTVPNQQAVQQGLYFRRNRNQYPDDGGQYGFKLQYSFPEEKAHIGAYFFNYNSRIPFFSAHENAKAPATAARPAPYNTVNFFYTYASHIKVYGLTADKTFSNIGNLSLNLSYIPQMPIALNNGDLGQQAVGDALGQENINPNIPQGVRDYVNAFGPGDDIDGFRQMGVERAQLTFTTLIPRVLKADKTLVALQTAFETIPNLPDKHSFRFGRASTFGVGTPDAHGYVTDFSAGYRLTLISTYANALGPVTLKPKLVVGNGLSGYSSDGSLNEHQRTVTVGLGAEYKHLNGELSYTNYNGTKLSRVRDRDYVSASLSYSF